MLPQSTAAQITGLPPADLELVNYGAGYAWFRRELDAAIRDADRVHQRLTRLLDRRPKPQPDDEPRYALTDKARRALAMERLFGPWPAVAQANASKTSVA
jgi:hypothetical protein